MLENALGEYNDNINELEPLWEFPELLEVYINRDCVQYMMEYCTSVLEDPESASGVIDILETQWYDMDAGTYVQVHVMMESSLLDEDKDCSAEYDLAALRLDGLRPDFHHYDRRNIVRTCKNACKNFINSGYPKDMEPYVRKALSLVI